MGAWLLWCLLHSLLASCRVKRYLGCGSSLSARQYRLCYVLFSTLTLAVLLFWQSAVISLPPPAGWPWQTVRLLLFAYAGYMLTAGGRAYDLKEFLGLTQPAPEPAAGATHFRRDGILARVRHPWYSGGIALLIAAGETPWDRWDWRALLLVYLLVGCLIEERRLVSELGEVYRQYQREVPMLLPGIQKGSASNRGR
jgi:protein-S-isoprenylcysteine O-methyltransferase Ste14